MAMFSKLIEATRHELTFNVEPLPGRRLGLPDTPSAAGCAGTAGR